MRALPIILFLVTLNLLAEEPADQQTLSQLLESANERFSVYFTVQASIASADDLAAIMLSPIRSEPPNSWSESDLVKSITNAVKGLRVVPSEVWTNVFHLVFTNSLNGVIADRALSKRVSMDYKGSSEAPFSTAFMDAVPEVSISRSIPYVSTIEPTRAMQNDSFAFSVKNRMVRDCLVGGAPLTLRFEKNGVTGSNKAILWGCFEIATNSVGKVQAIVGYN